MSEQAAIVNLRFTQINGLEGAVRVANREAATFSKWTLHRPDDAPGTWAFSARVKTQDAYLMTQGPDTLILNAGKLGRLRWKGVTLESSDDTVRATLIGSPEVL